MTPKSEEKETVAQFLKRGGKIQKIPTGEGVGFSPSAKPRVKRRQKTATKHG
jgi:hypothetical protein